MGCACNGSSQPAEYRRNYGIGYTPVEYNPTDVLTSVMIIGGMALIAYIAIGRAEKTKRVTQSERNLRRKLGMRWN